MGDILFVRVATRCVCLLIVSCAMIWKMRNTHAHITQYLSPMNLIPYQHSGHESKSLVARVLARVLDMVNYVGDFPGPSEHLFILLRDLAMGDEAIRLHLLGSGMAARLSIFITRDDTPQEVCKPVVPVCSLLLIR